MTNDYESFATAATADGFDLNDPSQAVTLAAFQVGPNIKRIASFLGRPREWVAIPAQRLRENGVWTSGRISVESDPSDEDFGLEVALQCAVAAGYMERSVR